MKDDDKGNFDPMDQDLEVNFMKLYLAAADWLANIDLTGRQYKILFKLFARLDYDNYIRISQKEIAEQLGIHFQDVSNTIRYFVERGIISEGGRVGRNKTYRLSQNIGFKGSKDSNVVSILRAATKQTKSKKKVKPPTQ